MQWYSALGKMSLAWIPSTAPEKRRERKKKILLKYDVGPVATRSLKCAVF